MSYITRKEALDAGFVIDNGQGAVAYKGSRFNPTVWHNTDTEEVADLKEQLATVTQELEAEKLMSHTLRHQYQSSEHKLAASQADADHRKTVIIKLAALATHSDKCTWATPLPTGCGYWGCNYGLDELVLCGEPTEQAINAAMRGKEGE